VRWQIGQDELEAQLRRSREALQGLGASRRKAKIVTVVGTICGFVVVGIFVWVFLSPFVKLGDPAEQERLTQFAKAHAEELGLNREELQKEADRAWKRLQPIYSEKIQQKLQGSDLQGEALKQVQQLANGVAPVYYKALKEKVEALGLVPLFRKQFDKAWEALWPQYSEILRQKIQESELLKLAAQQMQQESQKVWAVYSQLIQQRVKEMGLVDEVQQALQDVIDEAQPAYTAELDRIRPQLLNAFEYEGRILLEDLTLMVKGKLEESLKESILAQEDRLREDLGLSESELEVMLGTLVEANETALTRMIDRRTEGHRKLWAEIEAMLPDVGMSEEHELDVVADQMMKVLLLLLKYKLPGEYENLPLD